eukprot:scaffold3134_cov414-Prasinococcus_capsulatus_cf.AAC.27
MDRYLPGRKTDESPRSKRLENGHHGADASFWGAFLQPTCPAHLPVLGVRFCLFSVPDAGGVRGLRAGPRAAYQP